MTDPEIFIVRIWRHLTSGFRATARRVDEEEVHVFTEPDQVVRYLEQAGSQGAAATGGPSPAAKVQP